MDEQNQPNKIRSSGIKRYLQTTPEMDIVGILYEFV